MTKLRCINYYALVKFKCNGYLFYANHLLICGLHLVSSCPTKRKRRKRYALASIVKQKNRKPNKCLIIIRMHSYFTLYHHIHNDS